MTAKHLPFVALFLLLCISCTNDAFTTSEAVRSLSKINFSLGIRGKVDNSSTSTENKIDKIDVFCFSKKTATADYTFETRLEGITPTINGNHEELTMTLTGSLPRIFYFVANTTGNIPFINDLSNNITSSSFEEQLLVIEAGIPQSPLMMVTKAEKPTLTVADQMNVELSHAVSCLNIVNKYAGFVIDSLVLREAVTGSYLFKEAIPTPAEAPRLDLNYGNMTSIYLYPTDSSILTIYGKHTGVRAVFDIPLKNIKSATKYKVTFRSINDHTLDFVSNLKWEIKSWNDGAVIDSTPDWN